MTDKQTPPDWVLIEAAKRGGHGWKDQSVRQLRDAYVVVYAPVFNALCDMILKHQELAQEVSDAVEHYRSKWTTNARRDIFDAHFGSFIIAKADPLVEVVRELRGDEPTSAEQWTAEFLALCEQRGIKVSADHD